MKEPVLQIDAPWLSLDEYAKRCGLSRGVVESQCRHGHLPHKVIGRHKMVNFALILREAWSQENWKHEAK